jgi:hypothetical protein
MRSSTLLLLALILLSALSFGAATSPDAIAIMAEFDRETATELWPGFDPRKVPIEIFDGKQTWLFRHPKPPDDFKELPQHPGTYIFEGRHPSMRANTNTDLSGIPIATVDLSAANVPLREQAALVVHESFHIFQRARHPKWTANEADVFMYPLDNAGLLARRRQESEALRRALLARDAEESRCWAAEAIRVRDLRFSALPASSVAYEREIELYEGLANYLQVRAAGKTDSFNLPLNGFPAEVVRSRNYLTATAMALLLDRLAPGWRKEMEEGDPGSLDQLLKSKIYFAAAPCAFSDAEEAAIFNHARADVSALAKRLQKKKSDFVSATGWQIVVTTVPPELLNAEGFDPLNLTVVASGEVLHQRWLKLSNDYGSLEVLDRAALTKAAGAHPLFDGVKELTITGLKQRPEITMTDGAVRVSSEGVRAEFHHALVRTEGQKVSIDLGQQPASSSSH